MVAYDNEKTASRLLGRIRGKSLEMLSLSLYADADLDRDAAPRTPRPLRLETALPVSVAAL